MPAADPSGAHGTLTSVGSDGGMAPRAVLAVALLLLGACTETSTPAALDCPDRVDQMEVTYADDGEPLQRLDLYQPNRDGCAAVPLIVWVHGGGWRAGDKANGMAQKVRLWNDAGWAVASVNYRLTDARVAASDRVVAPSHNEDVAAAWSWLVTRSEALGVDPERMALLGHSAGAGIAAAVASDPTYLGAHDLDTAAIACSAPLDTEGFDISAVIEGGGRTGVLYRSVFGDDPVVWQQLSPVNHLGEGPVPDLLLVRRGNAARQAQVDAFAEAARGAGADVTIVDLPTFSHAEVSTRIGDPTDELLTPALQQFLDGCLTG